MSLRAETLVVLAAFLAVALAGCTAPPAAPAELKVGTIFPMTGSLAVFGPPVREAADLAAAQVNAAGGAAGARLRLVHEDSQTSAPAGTAAAQKLRSDGVRAIVGADASGVSKAVYEVAGPNRIVQVSPMSTSPEFTTIMAGAPAADRFFFRTSPSDALQGKVAGAYAVMKNWSSVVIIYDNNPYGNGLRTTFTAAYQGLGGAGAPARVARAVGFEEGQTSYDSVLQQAFAGCTAAAPAGCPGGVFFAGYPTEAELILTGWWANQAWRRVPWLFSEGVQDQGFFDKVRAKGISVEGFEGTAPVGTGPGFEAIKTLLGREPSLFQAHTFDATMLVALAAQRANSLDSTLIRNHLAAVAGPPGEKVGPADFARAVTLLREGRDIDYEGGAGSQNFDEFGDVTSAYEVYRLDAAGKLGRKCLVPEAEVIKERVAIPAACMAAAPAPPAPPPAGVPQLTFVLKETGGAPPKVWSIDPREASVAAGRSLMVTVRSDGASQAPHNLTLVDAAGVKVASYEPTLSGGQSAEFDVPPLAPGSYAYYCAVAGHRALGMEGALTAA